MGSPPGLKKANWSTPAGWLFKDIIHIYYKQGQRGDTIAESFRRHVPRDVYVPIIRVDVSDNAILQRGHKGVLEKNEFEHPDKHPMGKKMMAAAIDIVNNNKILTKEIIDQITNEALLRQEDIPIQQTIVSEEKGRKLGYLYVLGDGSDNCGIGITYQQNLTSRTDSFKKGDVNNTMEVKYALYLANPQVIETEIKQTFKRFHLGNERYKQHANNMIHSARVICDEKRIAYYNVDPKKKEN